MQIDITVINKVLASLDTLHYNKDFTKQSEVRTHTGVPDSDYDGRQGEFNEDTYVYSHVSLPSNMLVQVTTRTNSYGEGSEIVRIQFGKGAEKVISVFEAV